MRILSQDGMIDIPYEQSIISIDYRNRTNIISRGSNCCEHRPYLIAKYSTEAKAQRAMEMLRNEYHGYKVEEVYHEGTEYFHPIFQFPTDEELED